MDEVSAILDEMLREVPRRRNYNAAFGRVAEAIMRQYSVAIPPLDLRFRFALFLQEEYDALPRDQWRLDDPQWIREREGAAKARLLSWIEGEVGGRHGAGPSSGGG